MECHIPYQSWSWLLQDLTQLLHADNQSYQKKIYREDTTHYMEKVIQTDISANEVDYMIFFFWFVSLCVPISWACVEA